MVQAATEFRGMSYAIGRRINAIRVAVERDGGSGDHGLHRQPSLEIGIARIALGQTVAVTIAVDHDIDVVGIVEGRCGAREGRFIELPVWRPLLPEDLRDL